jgi:hypothetical protein
MTAQLEAAVLRTVAWFVTINYPPLLEEVVQDLDLGERWDGALPTKEQVCEAINKLVTENKLSIRGHRLVSPGLEELFHEHARRERVFPRKWRRIQKLARMMRFLPSVRFLAVCNTTALGSARDGADIDLFLVVKEGTLWLTRGFLTVLAAFAFRRPGQARGERDAWCFSFFIDDKQLNLERFSLKDDPYLRFWTRRLLLVLDDGIGVPLWEEQAWAWKRHPFIKRWLSWRVILPSAWMVPSWLRRLDLLAMKLQRRFGSRSLWAAADRAGTEVVLDAHTFKTHMDDRRDSFRLSYEQLCQNLETTP